MNRLQSELNRLYRLRPQPDATTDAPWQSVDADGRVRALVLELARPPSWGVLSAVWRGVQAELALPAPAIAVSGTDGVQLWFSLAEPVAPALGLEFLARLRQRFLPEVDARRVQALTQPAPVPAEQGHSGNWSAFVAPDLAPVFDDAPWLDIPPSDEGQAGLLSVIEPMKPELFEAAMRQLGAGLEAAAARPGPPGVQDAAVPTAAEGDARRFLQRVMHDESVTLALRIEAAKALLLSGRDR